MRVEDAKGVQMEKTNSAANAGVSISSVKLNFPVPEIKELLKTGAQFGHQTNKWNPRMKKFIFGEKGKVHIIDLSKTMEKLDEALKFLVSASSKGKVLFVATKRQAAGIVKEEALRAGAYYITNRWPGGFFSNFNMIIKSLKKLQKLEEDFETGVEGRTKYEVMLLKKEWSRLNRLYEGVKTVTTMPTAVVIIDPNFERKAVKEAIGSRVPIVGLVDTNSDPDILNYPVPGNDDAINSLRTFARLFADAVIQGNGGNGVKHNIKDYSKVEVKIVKPVAAAEEDTLKEVVVIEETQQPKAKKTVEVKESKEDLEQGILGRSREKSKKVKIKMVAKKEEKPAKAEKPKAPAKKVAKPKTAAKKAVKKVVKKAKK